MHKYPKKKAIISALLIIGVFYFSFMILDRILSLIYGFNFQPFGPYMPSGFTVWGHIFNGSAAALGLFLLFKLYDYGKEKQNMFLEVLAVIIGTAILLFIPYMNDAAHLAKNNVAYTLFLYVIANALYVFFWGLLMFKLVNSTRKRAIILLAVFALFLVIHFVLYAPMFPEFYWS